MLVNIIKKETKGSITIEAAIILPFVMCICLLIFSLSSLAYHHSRVQHILNQVCVELSYDSYMFYELGVIDSIQEINARSSGDTLTISDIQNFGKVLEENPLKRMASDVWEQTVFTNPIEFVEVASLGLDFIDKSIESSDQLKDTMVEEALYYVTTTYGRSYVKHKLEDYFKEAGLDIDFTIEHLELFNQNDSGVVVISYEHEFPFKLLKTASVMQVNSGYIRLFNGHGNYDENYHKDIETSSYGSGDKTNQEETDEDGYSHRVYITDYGVKYHKNPICFHIKVNVISLPLNMARSKKPCSHCANESLTNNNMMVFTTLASEVYHTSATCYSIYHNISILREKEAILKGYGPCGTCSQS